MYGTVNYHQRLSNYNIYQFCTVCLTHFGQIESRFCPRYGRSIWSRRMIESIKKRASSPTFTVLAQKQHELRDMMRRFGRVLVAYSGGVDSTYLAAVASEELGRDAFCLTG